MGGGGGVGVSGGVGFKLFDLLVGCVVDGVGDFRGVEHVVCDGPCAGLLDEGFVLGGGDVGHEGSCGVGL